MTPETATGLVLSSQNIGESDRRIVILTRERGKISAFAQGAVKPRNPLVSATQAFTFGEFFLHPGRDSYRVTGAEVKNHFPGLLKDIEKYYYATYLCEIAAYYTRENLNAEHELLLLYQSLKALEKDMIPNKLVRYIYEWRMLLIEGEYPDMSRCVRCGKTDGLAGLDTRKHGLICRGCMNKTADIISLKSSTIYTLQFIRSSDIKRLYTFTLKDEILEEFGMLTVRYLETTQNYNFNSLNGIEEIL